VLYQLSYTHHAYEGFPAYGGSSVSARSVTAPRPWDRSQSTVRLKAPPCRAAICWAVAESGPGGGTKTALR
jgi:hypothetical protein